MLSVARLIGIETMDKLVVGFVGGETDIDKAIKFFSDSEEYDITHSFVMILNSTFESRGVKERSDPYPRSLAS